MAAIALVKNPEASRASRHYQLKLHFLKNLQERSIFEYRHCTTDLQLAGSMTKPTPRGLFSKFRAWMGIALPIFHHLTVCTPRMFAKRAEAPHSTHDPSRQRAEDWKFFSVSIFRSTTHCHGFHVEDYFV